MLFSKWKIKNLEIKNRIVMPPMCQYQATQDGMATSWHRIHYATRAIGGVGLIIVESTAISSNGRITKKDLGIWEDSQISGLKEVVDSVHEYGGKIAIQLIHAGRKCDCDTNILAPSPIAFGNLPIPKEMSIDDIKEVVCLFKMAAKRAYQAGFDSIEIHGAHGYLVSQFLSPITNQRSDEYGKNRALFLQEVIAACKEVLPKDYPIMLRISANDYAKDGNVPTDFIELLNPFKDSIDCLDISTGGVVGNVFTGENVQIFAGYQTRSCEIIKHGLQTIPCISGGLISDVYMANEMIANERCDAVFIGRELLRNPYWALHASKVLNADMPWPQSYSYAK